MNEFQKYTGADLYDYCCGYILKRESIWNGSAMQRADQIEQRIKGVLKRRKAGRTSYIQKIIGKIQVGDAGNIATYERFRMTSPVTEFISHIRSISSPKNSTLIAFSIL